MKIVINYFLTDIFPYQSICRFSSVHVVITIILIDTMSLPAVRYYFDSFVIIHCFIHFYQFIHPKANREQSTYHYSYALIFLYNINPYDYFTRIILLSVIPILSSESGCVMIDHVNFCPQKNINKF